jgi:hypothetical protein
MVVDLPNDIREERERHIDLAMMTAASEKLKAAECNTVNVSVQGQTIEVSRRNIDGAILFGQGGNLGQVSSSTGYLVDGNRAMIVQALDKVAKGEFTTPQK